MQMRIEEQMREELYKQKSQEQNRLITAELERRNREKEKQERFVQKARPAASTLPLLHFPRHLLAPLRPHSARASGPFWR